MKIPEGLSILEHERVRAGREMEEAVTQARLASARLACAEATYRALDLKIDLWRLENPDFRPLQPEGS